jgi:hypothetical protein
MSDLTSSGVNPANSSSFLFKLTNSTSLFTLKNFP